MATDETTLASVDARAAPANGVLVLEAENLSDCMINLRIVFRGAAKSVLVRTGIFPHWPVRIALPLNVADGGTLFLKRAPGRFKTIVEGSGLQPADLVGIDVRVPAAAAALVKVARAEIATQAPTEYLLPGKPVVDGLHQWRGRNWVGKACSLDEVRSALEAELTGAEPDLPKAWSAYGGWTAKSFAASGWFRAEHDGTRWWLVDPDGGAFWSIGVDCVRAGTDVNVAGIESLFDPPLPGRDVAPGLWTERNGEPLFNAYGHNMERALGADWPERWTELTRRRLRSMRFNTIANWSDPRVYTRCRIPYVFTMAGFPTTARRIFRDFPDVYAPEYEANSRTFAEQLAVIRGDRFVIGYFMTNEPQWAFLMDFDLGRQLLRNEEPSATRDAWIAFLRERHETIERLNAVWGTHLSSFEALRGRVECDWTRADADTKAFTHAAVERYVRLPAQACRAVDPNHMNLGLRWAWIHSDYQLAGHQCLDAFSINCYELCPNAGSIAKLVAKTGKPVMIGEFHIGALDKGLPSGGIRNTRTMRESADAYRYYLEQAAAIPGLVGAHYFQWVDQPVLGRFDGENMQIGLQDITGRLYAELAESCRRTNEDLYAVAAGRRAPYAQRPNAVPDGTLIW